MMAIWFPEPTQNNPTVLKNGQDEFDWVMTSIHPNAKVARKFLNFNLNRLPSENQRELYEKLKTHWLSTLFEIIVGRTLQAIGATVTFEREISSGRKPDFHVKFRNQTIIIEAVSPQFHLKEIARQTTGVDRLETFIEQQTPQDYSVYIHALPTISRSSSLKPHKKILIDLLSSEKWDESDFCKLHRDTNLGLYELTLMRRQPGFPVLLGKRGGTYYSQANKYISEAWKDKKRQVKGAGYLRILAINGNFQCTLSDLDKFLFGRKVENVNGEIEFKADGKFGKPICSSPSFDGVLFFEVVGFLCKEEPILYVNPQSSRSFPKELENFRQRLLVNGKEIKEIQPKNLNIMADLKPVDI